MHPAGRAVPREQSMSATNYLREGGDRRVQGETMLDLEIQNIQLYARPLSKRTPAFESHARIQDAVYTRVRV